MKILLIGGSKIQNAARALEQRFNTLEAVTATTLDQLELYGNSGLRFDRILLFEQVITLDGDILDKREIRKRTQDFMNMMKELFETFELVGVADNNEVMQSLREEMFEIKHRAVVVKVKASALSANILAGIASKSIPDLREIYKEVDVDRSIYRNPSTVMWSSDIESNDDWDISVEHVRLGRGGKTKARFNEHTMEWEEIQPSGQENAAGTGQELQQQAGVTSVNKKGTEKKKFSLFGNRKA